MANQQLVDYIKSQLAAGVTKPDLQKAIETAGWSAQDMTDAFNVVEGKAPATPAPATPKPATPVQPAQPVQQPKPAPVQQPIQPIGPTTQLPPTMQPILNPAGPTSTVTPNLGGPMRASTMQMNVERGGPRSRIALWVTIIVLVFVVAIGAAVYLFLPQIQEIVSFYLGGQVPAPIVEEQTQLPPVTEPVATTTATTTPTASGVVASSTASTTLGQ